MKPRCSFTRAALIAIAVPTLCLCVGVGAAEDQKLTKKQVPAAVVAAFAKTYPRATVRGYAREKEGGKVFYEVESIEGKTTRDVLFNADGSIVEVEESVAAGDLPQAIVKTVGDQYPKATIRVAEKVTRGADVKYELRLRQGKKNFGLEFDSTGKLLKSPAK